MRGQLFPSQMKDLNVGKLRKKIKIGGLLDLPANQRSQSGPFSLHVGRIDFADQLADPKGLP